MKPLPSYRFPVHFLLFVFCCLFLTPVWSVARGDPEETLQTRLGREDQPAPATDKSNLGPTIERLISEYGLAKSKVGIKIVSLPDAKVLYEKDAELLLIPASNLKLFTTAAALCRLGPDFQYETKLYRLGPIRDGVLKGKLIVKSNGDPNISGRFYEGNTTAVFEEWGKVLRNLRVKRIKSGIIIDDTAFDRDYTLSSWPADQLSYWYCAQISGVSFNDNCVDITVYFDKDTDEIKYRLDPPTDYVTIINNCEKVSRKSDHEIDFYRAPGTNTITIKGKFWEDAKPHKESVTIDNPGLWFGTVLKETLVHKKGIPVFGKIRLAERTYREKEDHLICLASVKTDLVTTIGVVNKRSQNFYADQALKALGYHFTGQGTFKTGLAQVRKFLVDEVKISEDSLKLVDGSGLSKENRVSPTAVIKMLTYLYKHKYGKEFQESLAGNDQDKGLRKRLRDNYKDRVLAKTGYLKGVSALSGYLHPDTKAGGGDYAFSIIINDAPDRASTEQFQNEILKLLFHK